MRTAPAALMGFRWATRQGFQSFPPTGKDIAKIVPVFSWIAIASYSVLNEESQLLLWKNELNTPQCLFQIWNGVWNRQTILLEITSVITYYNQAEKTSVIASHIEIREIAEKTAYQRTHG